MTTARDFLAAVQQRADAATDGPWTIRRRENAVVREPDGLPSVARLWVADVDVDHEDAEFIAAARTDVPRLAAALTAALDLHAFDPAVEGIHSDGCRHCQRPWPCETVRVITDALTPKENDRGSLD